MTGRAFASGVAGFEKDDFARQISVSSFVGALAMPVRTCVEGHPDTISGVGMPLRRIERMRCAPFGLIASLDCSVRAFGGLLFGHHSARAKWLWV